MRPPFALSESDSCLDSFHDFLFFLAALAPVEVQARQVEFPSHLLIAMPADAAEPAFLFVDCEQRDHQKDDSAADQEVRDVVEVIRVIEVGEEQEDADQDGGGCDEFYVGKQRIPLSPISSVGAPFP